MEDYQEITKETITLTKESKSRSSELNSIIVRKSKIILLFLSLFLIVNIIFLFSNIKTIKKNKGLNNDNLMMYELVEITNVTRVIDGRRIDYLESIIESNGIDLNILYSYDISDQVQEEYNEKLEKLEKLDYNDFIDRYLKIDYSSQLQEKRESNNK